MIKWKILAVAGLTFGVIGMGLAVAAQRSDPQVFELRIYKAMPGKRGCTRDTLSGSHDGDVREGRNEERRLLDGSDR